MSRKCAKSLSGESGNQYRYCWSNCAFSILLSLARLFWNQILICVSVSLREAASSNLRPLEMYSPRRYSTSNLRVCSPLNVVLCLRGRPSFLLLRATRKRTKSQICCIWAIFIKRLSRFLVPLRFRFVTKITRYLKDIFSSEYNPDLFLLAFPRI